ncbi:MAG TPA: VOC family protein [Gemmatimonadales bacterium]|nr:VOC family protein [Gemmatimonadales bacterium]
MTASAGTTGPQGPAPMSYGIAPPGYRLPAGIRLGTVRLQVADLDRSLAWYQRVLGVRVIDRAPGRASLGAETGGVLLELHERTGAHPVPRRGRLGLYHFAILLPDRGSLARFVRHLSAIGERAGMSDHLVSEAIYLSDPDGLGIEVYADRPRADWRTADRQLVMATEPLDVPGLLSAGGTGDWRALPEGTVIGHVHLFVGDLARAEAFYHAGLGLDKVVWSYPGALFLSAGGYHHHLGTNTWAAGAAPAGPEDARLLEWELVLPSGADVDQALASLAASGAEVAPAMGEGGGSAVRDPWGTALRLRT